MANEIRTYRSRETVRAFQFDPDAPLPEGFMRHDSELPALISTQADVVGIVVGRGGYVWTVDACLSAASAGWFEDTYAPIPAVAPSNNPACVCSFCDNTATDSRIVEGGKGKPNICAECVGICTARLGGTSHTEVIRRFEGLLPAMTEDEKKAAKALAEKTLDVIAKDLGSEASR